MEIEVDIEILPCPFCGNRGVVADRYDAALDFEGKNKHFYGVSCEVCYAQTESEYTVEDAIETWNRRVR